MGGKETRQLQAESEKKVNCQRLEGEKRHRTITRPLSKQIYGLVWAIQHSANAHLPPSTSGTAAIFQHCPPQAESK